MREVFLVRHGETDWNALKKFQGLEDIPLNENGLAQAHQVAAAFEGIGIQRVISSKLSRASKTAEIIAERLALPTPTIIEELHERNYGEGSGLTREERAARFPLPSVIPGEESYADLQERVVKVFHYIVEHFFEEKILVVTHGSVMKSLIGHFLHYTDTTKKVVPVNCGVMKVVEAKSGWGMAYFNLTPEELSEREKKFT